MNTRILSLWLGVALMALTSGIISGCGDDMDDMIQNSAPAKKAVAKKAEADDAEKATDEAKPEDVAKSADYVYTSVGKRDPFRSPFEDLEADEIVGSEDDRVIGPLQTYDLSSFTVSGIIWGTTSPTAMVVAPDNSSYIVKVGTLIGKNWGKVTKIKQDRIVVQEVIRKGSGQKITQTTELKLPLKRITPMTSGSFEDTEEAL